MNVYKELAKLDKKTLLAIASVSSGDGHTIFSVKAYQEAGMPENLIKHFARTHVSDTSDPKSTIFTREGVVKELRGIYGLNVVEAIVAALDLPRSSAMGRGFRAQQAIAEIVKACQE